MSSENGKQTPRGFAAMSDEKRKEISAKGGQAKVRKGFGSLDEGARKENASRAAKIRWQRVREQRANNDSDVQRQESRDTGR